VEKQLSHESLNNNWVVDKAEELKVDGNLYCSSLIAQN
jgi:hypothetical protein